MTQTPDSGSGMNEAGQKITEGVNQAVDSAQDAIKQLQNSEAFQNASDTLEDLLAKAQEVLGDLFDEVKDQVEQFIEGMKKDESDTSAVGDAVRDAVEGGPESDTTA